MQQNNPIIRPLQHPRQGWEEQFRIMAEHGDDQLLDSSDLGGSIRQHNKWTGIPQRLWSGAAG